MRLFQDVSYAGRILRKMPGFTVTAVTTLAVGIGLTSAVYSVCDALLWKPVGLPHLETLAMVLQAEPGANADSWTEITPADLDDIRRDSRVMERMATWRGAVGSMVVGGDQPAGILESRVSANFYNAVGVSPFLGRSFAAGEDQPGHDREVILSDEIWKRRFGADPGVLGKTVRLDDREFVITGVMPDSFNFPLATDVWIPDALSPQELSSRRSNMLIGLARVKPGRRIAEASAEVKGIGTRLENSYPDTNRQRRFIVRPAHRFLVNYQREQYLIMLLSSVLFVLLIACVNVANLQFARATGRVREVSLRTALGASRSRIVSQLLTESVLISFLGAGLGLVVAKWAVNMIKLGMPSELQRFVVGWKNIELDSRALVFTLIAAVASGILAGIAPAWQSSHVNLADILKEGGRGGSSGASRHLLRNVLVGAEIAFAVLLLAGAGLMVRGFQAQLGASASLEPASLLTLRLAISNNKYREPHQVFDFYRDVLNRITIIPGVRAAAAATALPYSGHSSATTFAIEGQQTDPNNAPRAMYQAASPSLFKTLHIPLRAGRLLNESDGPEAPKVAVISEKMAVRWWKNESPIGKHITELGTDANAAPLTIVGIVGDMIYSPYDREPRQILYVPYQQAPRPWMDVAVRASVEPMSLARAVTAAVRAIDRQQPISEMRTMESSIHNSAIGLNYMAVLMGVFGLFAFGLSAIGVYGVMSHVVAEQTREIGIRMALGAQRHTILTMVFRRGVLTIIAGLIAGLPLAYGLSHLLASVIYGVSASDLVTFTGIPLALIVAALLAIYLPAWRAMKTDPINALRYE